MMTKDEAKELLTSSFVELSAYNKAKEFALSLATKNQKALFDNLPFIYQHGFLVALLEK